MQGGWMRAKARASSIRPRARTRARPELPPRGLRRLPPDQFVPVTIPLYYQGHMYRTGSQIRVRITAPNGDQPIWSFAEADPAGPANVAIGYGGSRPSRLVLPVVAGVTTTTGLPPCPGLRGEPCRDYQPFQNEAASLTDEGGALGTTRAACWGHGGSVRNQVLRQLQEAQKKARLPEEEEEAQEALGLCVTAPAGRLLTEHPLDQLHVLNQVPAAQEGLANSFVRGLADPLARSGSPSSESSASPTAARSAGRRRGPGNPVDDLILDSADAAARPPGGTSTSPPRPSGRIPPRGSSARRCPHGAGSR